MVVLVVFVNSVAGFVCGRGIEVRPAFFCEFCIGLLELVSDPLLVTKLFKSLPLLLHVFLSLFLVNLLLQFYLHCSSLLFLLQLHDRFLIAAPEDAPLLLEFQVQTPVGYSSSRHNGWEVGFRLNRRVYCLVLGLLVRRSVLLLWRWSIRRWLIFHLQGRRIVVHLNGLWLVHWLGLVLLVRRLLLVRWIRCLVGLRGELL